MHLMKNTDYLYYNEDINLNKNYENLNFSYKLRVTPNCFVGLRRSVNEEFTELLEILLCVRR
uniref:Uncharacterized protein n=1 Tax=Romanomermis culicivorax TaxID=13658 RepID=A0A915I516_ROMCU